MLLFCCFVVLLFVVFIIVFDSAIAIDSAVAIASTIAIAIDIASLMVSVYCNLYC